MSMTLAVALAIPRLASRQHSPRRRRLPPVANSTSRAQSSMRAKPMKLLGLNLTIPFAVRSGGCCFRLRCSGSRFHSPARPNLGKRSSGRSRLRGTVVSGRFRARKLVGSVRHSKCFFAGAQCPAIMALRSWPCDHRRGIIADHGRVRFRRRVSWRRERAAYL